PSPRAEGPDRPGRGRGPAGVGGHPMRIGITANPHIPSALDSAKHVVARLEPAQEVVLESDLARAFGRNGMPLAHMKTEVVLAIGGDGTILRALQLSDSKVLGINSGSLGLIPRTFESESWRARRIVPSP